MIEQSGGKQVMTIGNLSKTLNAYKLLNKSEKKMMEEMLEFNELHSTIDTVTHYTKLLTDINNKIEKSKMKKELKEAIRLVITHFISLTSSNECKDIIIQDQAEKIVKQSIFIKEIEDEYQKERNEHNMIRKKHNEQLKEENINFMPSVDLSITLKQNRKPLSNKECVEFAKKINTTELDINKFKRVSIQNENENISRVYAKKGGHTIIQKNSTTKK